jgi:DNA-binding transcriptional MerR regulator
MDKKVLKSNYTIEEVSEIAGVNSFTLRNWEDRYSLFSPERDANGRRIFSESDTIRAIIATDLTNRHFKISRVAADLQNARDPNVVLNEAIEGSAFVEMRNETIAALLRFELNLFQQNFMHLLGNYDVEFIADHFFYPAYRELEALKVSGQITSFQFRFVQHHLAARIFRLTGSLKANRAHENKGRVLITGFPENEFEDSILILYLVLERNGWKVFYGGPCMPMNELEDSVKATGPDLVIFVGNNLTIAQFDEHAPVLNSLSVPVIVGGRLSLNLIAAGRKSSAHLEFSPLRPGPLSRLLRYKVTDSAELL